MTFLPCTISHQAAENVAASLTKDMRVLVTGVLQQRIWHTLHGDERYAYEIAATEVGTSLNQIAPRFSEVAPGTTSGCDCSSDDPTRSVRPSKLASHHSSNANEQRSLNFTTISLR